MIEIREVKTKRDIRLFATYPVKLYKDCPYYVPTIRGDEMNTFNPKKNFNLKHSEYKGFLCYKDGVLVGRIAGLISRKYNELSGGKYIRFSRFECIDDIEVFKALLGAVERFGKEKGMEVIHGPWGFNDTDREGMLTYGFDKRSTYVTNYYYPYFCERMKELGFNDESKWIERKFVVPDEPYDRILELGEKIKKKYGLIDVAETMSVRKIVKRYGMKLFDTVNEAYGHLDGYVPVDEDTIKTTLAQFVIAVNPKYLSVLIDKNDNVAAFGIVFASMAEALVKSKGKLFPTGWIGVLRSIKKPKELEMALIGVRNEYKNSGMNAVVMSRIMKSIIDNKIEVVESNPMLETNYNIQQQWKFTENEVIKKRQTYTKPIGSLIEEAALEQDLECAVTNG